VPGLDCDDAWAQVSAWLVMHYVASVVDWIPARKSRRAAVRELVRQSDSQFVAGCSSSLGANHRARAVDCAL
jgi:hypothetical protein